MKNLRGVLTVAGLGLLVMGMVSNVGCSSSDDKTGAGGSGGGGTGSGGAAVITSGALITDFSAATAWFSGSPYQGAGAGWTTPAVTASGSLHVVLSAGAAAEMYTGYAYFGIPLNNPPVDASAVTGVTFTASGTVTGTGCQIQYSTVDQDHALTDNNGHCASGDNCYPSSKVFVLATTPTPVTVLWADQIGGMGTAAAPSTVNAAQILNLQWQVQTSGGAVGDSCTADVTIDDVKWQ